MLWTIINIVLIVVGFLFIGWADHIDNGERFDAVVFFLFGCILIGVGVISAVVKSIF